MSFKKVFNTSLIIACATIGAIGAAKKYKHVFLTRPILKTDKLHTKDTQIAAAQAPQVIQEAAPSQALAKVPQIDRMYQLFSLGSEKFPIVETVSFTPKVTWTSGKLAWIEDYASHFKTSKHFIARSLHGKPDYFSQQISMGEKFNVYKLDRPFDFHMVVDLGSRQMALYYYDHTTKERVMLKTYSVGVGRVSEEGVSLTPTGTYKIGSKTAIYRPGIMGTFHNERVEMVTVFGSRWLPFEPLDKTKENPVKGLGIYGLPASNTENAISLEQFSSDGGVCMKTDEIEELYAVILTKPTFVYIVSHLDEAILPGTEVVTPTR